jgi:hypothetical protein
MTLGDKIFWVVVGAATAPVWGTLLWCVWEGEIRPLLIPNAEIDRLAAEMIARHGHEAEEQAAADEQTAWYNSDATEQGKWRRVRRRIARRGAGLS